MPVLAATPRGGALLLVILFHASGLLALLAIEPFRLLAEEPRRLEVHLVNPAPPPAPVPLETEIPLPEETPPPEFPPDPQLELAVEEPQPDLPPPVFQILEAALAAMPRLEPPPPPPPPPKPEPPKPAAKVPPPPRATALPPKPPAPAVVDAFKPAPPSDTRSMLKTVTEADIRYRKPPRPVYPFYAKRAQEFGSAIVSVLIDVSGRPEEVLLEKSSSHGALDREALRAVRDALFEPFLEDGVPRPVRVSIPVHFVLVRERHSWMKVPPLASAISS